MSNVDLKSELENLNKEITTFKSKVSEVNDEKEKLFKKKEDLKVQINELVQQLKDLKKKNDVSTKAYDDLRGERDKYNSQVKAFITDLKKLNDHKKAIFDKYNIKEDPSFLKSRIEKLEMRIETEALSFKKEREVMDEIRKLKKVYGEAKEAKEVIAKIEDLSKQLNVAKEKANEFHKQLVEVSKTKGYSDFIDLTKRINFLRKEQEGAFDGFIKMKNEFSKANMQFKARILRARQIMNELQSHDKRERRSTTDDIMTKRVESVEQKLKAKKKLTTEDLLIMQGKDDKGTDHSVAA